MPANVKVFVGAIGASCLGLTVDLVVALTFGLGCQPGDPPRWCSRDTIASDARFSLIMDVSAMIGLLVAAVLVINRRPAGRLLSITIWAAYLLLEVCAGLGLAIDPDMSFEPKTFAGVPIVLLSALVAGTSMVRLR